MPNRQVRLDPDVAELVDEQAAAWGSSSSSATVNRMLREAVLQPAQDRSSRVSAAPVTSRAAPAPRAASGVVERPASRTSSRASRADAQARASARASATGSGASRASSKCKHPPGRRIGDHCADCLQKV